MQTTELMLIRRGFLLAQPEKEAPEMAAYYAAKLLNTFGVLVSNPLEVTKEHVKLISEFYGVNIPQGFYKNPQDLRYYTSTELLIEQLVSYIRIDLIDGVTSPNPETFKRMEIFKKVLPDYKEGEEVTFRTYVFLTPLELIEKLKEIGTNLATYTRKWSLEEESEFKLLYDNKYISEDTLLKSKDNAITMFLSTKEPQFAKSLDKKDVVKLSVDMIGETKSLDYDKEQAELLRIAIQHSYNTPMSKKQAKFYNQIVKKISNVKQPKLDNRYSPYKKAKELLKEKKTVEAAKVFAKSGSLLERNLTWLLSRAKTSEIQPILDLVEIKNPIVAIQLMQTLTKDTQGRRTFKFYKNNKVRTHVETDAEALYRKSTLSTGVKEEIKEVIGNKINDYYKALPSFGKVYISDDFKRIPIVFNTSASGSGLDALPLGSRIPLKSPNIRAFTHWNGIYDVDTSATLVYRDGETRDIGFWNYNNKEFGNSVLHSGDNRSYNGVEYIDFRLDELRDRGVKHIFYSINGYDSKFNRGETYSGFQFKEDLNTEAWQPNNMALKLKVFGDARAFHVFGIDLDNMEVIIFNIMSDSNDRRLSEKDLEVVKDAMDSKFIDFFNIHRIVSLRATELVDNPEDADVVFDKTYIQKDNEKVQEIVRPFDVEKLVRLLDE